MGVGLLLSSNQQDLEEIKKLKLLSVKNEKEIKSLQAELNAMRRDCDGIQIELYSTQKERDVALFRVEKLMAFLEEQGLVYSAAEDEELELESRKNASEEYIQKIDSLKQSNLEQEKMIRDLQSEYEHLLKSSQLEYNLLKEKTTSADVAERKLKKAEKKISELESKLAEREKAAQPNLNISILSGINDVNHEQGVDEDDEFYDINGHPDILSEAGNDEIREFEINFEQSAKAARIKLENIDTALKEKETLFQKMAKKKQGLQKVKKS